MKPRLEVWGVESAKHPGMWEDRYSFISTWEETFFMYVCTQFTQLYEWSANKCLSSLGLHHYFSFCLFWNLETGSLPWSGAAGLAQLSTQQVPGIESTCLCLYCWACRHAAPPCQTLFLGGGGPGACKGSTSPTEPSSQPVKKPFPMCSHPLFK